MSLLFQTISLNLDPDDDSRLPTDEEEDDDVIWLGSDDGDEEEDPGVPRLAAADLSSVGLSEVVAAPVPRGKSRASKKMAHNRFGRTLGSLVSVLVCLILVFTGNSALVCPSSLVSSVYP